MDYLHSCIIDMFGILISFFNFRTVDVWGGEPARRRIRQRSPPAKRDPPPNSRAGSTGCKTM